MNTLFVDTFSFKDEKENKKNIKNYNCESFNNNRNKNTYLKNKKDIKILNLLKYKLDFDILSHGNFYNNINLKIDKNMLNKFSSENKIISLNKKIFEINLKRKLSNLETLYLVFCKELDKEENSTCKEYIINLLSSLKNTNLKEIIISNKMSINDIHYINEYVKKANINPNKLKILVAIDSILDYSNDKMIEYISKYKCVDILKMSGIDKAKYRSLNENIEKINDEYGSAIEITQKRNIQEYNVYLIYSKINSDEFKSHYILRKKSKVINMHNEEEDILNSNIKAYERNKKYLETLFNRIDIDEKNYSKNKLGALMLEGEEFY